MQAQTNSWHSTVPTKDSILVPETLLKKRKSQEKAREERTAADAKKKAVRILSFPFDITPEWQTDNMMHNTIYATRVAIYYFNAVAN